MGRARARQVRVAVCPLREPARACSYAIAERVAWYVSSPTRTPFTGAADCSRAAVLTTSPETMPSPCAGFAATETSASPVLTAIAARRDRRVRGSRARRERPAPDRRRAPRARRRPPSRRRRCTSRPCRRTTRSPSARARSTAPGSPGRPRGRAAPNASVNPTRSTKRTVTILRSSASAGAEFGSGAAHELQKRAPRRVLVSAVGTGLHRTSVRLGSDPCGVRPLGSDPSRSFLRSARGARRRSPRAASRGGRSLPRS